MESVEQPNLFSSLGNSILLWAILVSLVVMTCVNVYFVNSDDTSYYRAASYLSRSSNDPIMRQIRDHLEQRASQLSPQAYSRYKSRLDVIGNYLATNMLISFWERFPLVSAYQSFFLSLVTLFLAASGVLFFVMGWQWGRQQGNWLKFIFLLSALPSLVLFRLGRLLVLFPFQDAYNSYNWIAPVPRSVSLLFFFSSLLLWHNAGNTAHSNKLRLGLAVLFSSISLMPHLSMGILLIISTTFVAGLEHLVKYDPLTLAIRLGLKRFLLLFNISWLSLAGLTILGLGWLYGFEHTDIHGFSLVHAIESNILVYLWLRLRLSVTGKVQLQDIGDVSVRYFVAVAILVLSTSSVGLTTSEMVTHWKDPLFLAFSEVGRRLSGLAHILWWMISGIYLCAQLGHLRSRILKVSVIGVLILLCLGSAAQLTTHALGRTSSPFDQTLLTIQVAELLARPGVEAYASEVLYFQSIANEFRYRVFLQTDR